jgi:hypothetical protein
MTTKIDFSALDDDALDQLARHAKEDAVRTIAKEHMLVRRRRAAARKARKAQADEVARINAAAAAAEPTPSQRAVLRKARKAAVLDALLASIALAHLRIETLETRHSDSLDFHDCGVASIKAALLAAYEAGKAGL